MLQPRHLAWLCACLWPLLLAPGTLAKRPPPPGLVMPPDTRPPGCAEQRLDLEGRNFSDLKVSIIIPYRNERWDHIKGTVQGILYFTPKRYLAEILFVSDGNAAEAMHIHELCALSKLVSFLVLPSPGEGLISAKMRAARAASLQASVLVFLEPHVRVNRQWLEPLLARIRRHPNALVMPFLDMIPAENFNLYVKGSPGHWRFEWNLNLAYTNPANLDDTSPEPFLSPATSGGIFAIRRETWDRLGFYDHGMVGWGGDQTEASFKAWMCGGHIEIVPCSRVGHLFRSAEQRPYQVEVQQVVRNYARQAAVWFDEYLPSFHRVKPESKDMDIGDLTQPRELRKRLKCRNMSWYLETVDRELQWERDHICIPGCSRALHGSVCCERDAAPTRSTIDRIIPEAEYRPLPHPDVFVENLAIGVGSSTSRDEL